MARPSRPALRTTRPASRPQARRAAAPAQRDPAARSRWLERLAALALCLLAAAMTLRGLGEKSLWIDEVFSVLASRNWGELWSTYAKSESNMLLYFGLLHLWLKLGQAEFLVRALSAVSAILTVPAIYVTGKRLFGPWAGLLAALLLSVNLFFVRYAQEARSYALLLLLTTLSTYWFLRALQNRARRDWIAWVLVSTLSVYAHLFALLVLAAQALSLLARNLRDLPWRPLIISALAMGALALPTLVLQPLDAHQLDWVQAPTGESVRALIRDLAGGQKGVLWGYLLLWMAGLSVGATKAAVLRQRLGLWPYVLAVIWLFAPIALAYVYSLTVHPVFVDRYFIVCLSPLILLAAEGLAGVARWRGPTRWLAVAALVLVMVGSWRSISTWYDTRSGEAWREVTAYVVGEAKPGDAAVFYAWFVDQPFLYYRDKLGSPAYPELPKLATGSYPAGGGSRLPDPDPAQLASLRDRYRRVWLVLSHDSLRHLGRDVQSRNLREALQRQYGAPKEVAFPGVRVLLYGN